MQGRHVAPSRWNLAWEESTVTLTLAVNFDPWPWLTNLTEIDHTEYQGHTHSGPIAQPGPLKWSINVLPRAEYKGRGMGRITWLNPRTTWNADDGIIWSVYRAAWRSGAWRMAGTRGIMVHHSRIGESARCRRLSPCPPRLDDKPDRDGTTVFATVVID